MWQVVPAMTILSLKRENKRARTIIVFGLAAFFWTPDASALFLKNALKNATIKVNQQVKQEITPKG